MLLLHPAVLRHWQNASVRRCNASPGSHSHTAINDSLEQREVLVCSSVASRPGLLEHTKADLTTVTAMTLQQNSYTQHGGRHLVAIMIMTSTLEGQDVVLHSFLSAHLCTLLQLIVNPCLMQPAFLVTAM